MRRVVLFGTFDILHPGHIALLSFAKKKGDWLTVILARDSTVKKLKGYTPVHTARERKKILESLRMVDSVALGDTVLGSYRVLKKVKPESIVFGFDQEELARDIHTRKPMGEGTIQMFRAPQYGHTHASSSIRKRILE
jgi:FAD synthetase